MIQILPVYLFQDATDFVTAEHNRHPNRQAGPRHLAERADFNAEHVLVQKQQRAERLILRGGTHVSLDCEPGQKTSRFQRRPSRTGASFGGRRCNDESSGRTLPPSGGCNAAPV